MSPTTSDRDDPRLTHGADTEPTEQAEVYFVLSAEERAKGFVRPVRHTYVHVGPAGPNPAHHTRPLTPEEHERYDRYGYVLHEDYAAGPDDSVTGRFWTQAQLDAVRNGGCGARTTMKDDIAETYARDPHTYGSTWCMGCSMHRPVGEAGEFVWHGTAERVGT